MKILKIKLQPIIYTNKNTQRDKYKSFDFLKKLPTLYLSSF